MPDDPPVPTEQATTLQEAMDTIVQAFEHPSTLQISYSTADGQKRTTSELETGTRTVELTYDGRDDDAEPTLTRRDCDGVAATERERCGITHTRDENRRSGGESVRDRFDRWHREVTVRVRRVGHGSAITA